MPRECARAIRWRMRSSDAECNQISPKRTVQRAKFHKNLPLSAASARFWFIDSTTVHRCGTGNAALNPFCGKSRHTAVLHVGFWCEER
jgi:hypothetical protein